MKEILALINNHLSENEYKFECGSILKELYEGNFGGIIYVITRSDKICRLDIIETTIGRLLKIHGIHNYKLFYTTSKI